MLVVFEEAFLHRLLPLFHETTLTAIRSLRPDDYVMSAAVAGIGALAASALLYAMGIWLRRLPERISTESQRARIEILRLYANEWLVWLLILSPTPFGGILIISSGFFAISKVRAALAITAAELLWRLSPLL